MKELHATVSDEEFAELEPLAQALGVPLEELLLRSVAAYLTQVKAERAVAPRRVEVGGPEEPMGRGGRTAWPPGDTTGRISTSCSLEQIGQFWTRRLWRQKVGIMAEIHYRSRLRAAVLFGGPGRRVGVTNASGGIAMA